MSRYACLTRTHSGVQVKWDTLLGRILLRAMVKSVYGVEQKIMEKFKLTPGDVVLNIELKINGEVVPFIETVDSIEKDRIEPKDEDES